MKCNFEERMFPIIRLKQLIISEFVTLHAFWYSLYHYLHIMEVRCRHCCKSLFKGDSALLNAHHEVKQRITDIECQGDDCCSYMTPENVPDWIMDAINQESWTKGKLHCPYCNSRLGSFNFVNELKCCCDKYVKPPIRIVNSKVDILCESSRQ